MTPWFRRATASLALQIFSVNVIRDPRAAWGGHAAYNRLPLEGRIPLGRGITADLS